MVLKLSLDIYFDFKNSNDLRIYLFVNFLLVLLLGILMLLFMEKF